MTQMEQKVVLCIFGFFIVSQVVLELATRLKEAATILFRQSHWHDAISKYLEVFGV